MKFFVCFTLNEKHQIEKLHAFGFDAVKDMEITSPVEGFPSFLRQIQVNLSEGSEIILWSDETRKSLFEASFGEELDVFRSYLSEAIVLQDFVQKQFEVKSISLDNFLIAACYVPAEDDKLPVNPELKKVVYAFYALENMSYDYLAKEMKSYNAFFSLLRAFYKRKEMSKNREKYLARVSDPATPEKDRKKAESKLRKLSKLDARFEGVTLESKFKF